MYIGFLVVSVSTSMWLSVFNVESLRKLNFDVPQDIYIKYSCYDKTIFCYHAKYVMWLISVIMVQKLFFIARISF